MPESLTSTPPETGPPSASQAPAKQIDECALVTLAEIKSITGRPYRVVSRSAGPGISLSFTDLGWGECAYGHESAGPGHFYLSIGVFADSDFRAVLKSLRANKMDKELQPIEGVGDDAWALITHGENSGTTDQVELWVKRGDDAIKIVEYADPRMNSYPAIRLAHKVIQRLPDEFSLAADNTGEVCVGVDLDLASEAIGADVEGTREHRTARREYGCTFTGAGDAYLFFAVRKKDRFATTDVKEFAKGKSVRKLAGVGSEAYLDLGSDANRRISCYIVLEQAILEIYIDEAYVYDSESDELPEELGPEQRDLLDYLVDEYQRVP